MGGYSMASKIKSLAWMSEVLLIILSLQQFGPLKGFGETPLRDSMGWPIGATPTQLAGVLGVIVGGIFLFGDNE